MEIKSAKVIWLAALIILVILLPAAILFSSQFTKSGDEISITLIPPAEFSKYRSSDNPEFSGGTGVEPGSVSPTANVPDVDKDLGILWIGPRWSTFEFTIKGFQGKDIGPEINPFQIPVEVNFTGPAGQIVAVPAFFDGDGSGGQSGATWRVRFFPGEVGRWTFETQSPQGSLNGWRGEFEVENNPECELNREQVSGFDCKGTLQSTGRNYLRFENGDYWLKLGLDDPENFLGTAFGDWQAKKKAIDYLHEYGINSVYIILNNIAGDRNDTWAWLGETPQQAKVNSDRFDISKMAEWEDFFSYVQSKGIVLHLVFNDDSAWTGYDHDLFLREIIARFAHHPGIIWNVGEEANEIYSDLEQELLADRIRQLDPYDHPVTVHRRSPWPFLGNQRFTLASLQVGDGASELTSSPLPDYNAIVIEHREKSKELSHVIPVMIDETPRVSNVNPETREKLRKQVVYPILMAGGNFELHYRDVYGQKGTVSIYDLEPMLADMHIAGDIIAGVPFSDMDSCNSLLSDPMHYCFGKVGETYLIYFPEGGTESIDLSSVGGEFSATWIDPRTGELIFDQNIIADGSSTFSTPKEGDWLLQIRRPNAPE